MYFFESQYEKSLTNASAAKIELEQAKAKSQKLQLDLPGGC